MQYTSHKFGQYLMTPTFSQKYSRTTAEGRRLWSSIESLRFDLHILIDAIDDKVFQPQRNESWPDIRPSSQAARSLIEALGRRPLPMLQWMEWNSGRAAYVRHLASTLYKQLHALHDEPDCMSVRFLQPTGSGSDQLRKYIEKLRGDLLSFYGFADALRRGM